MGHGAEATTRDQLDPDAETLKLTLTNTKAQARARQRCCTSLAHTDNETQTTTLSIQGLISICVAPFPLGCVVKSAVAAGSISVSRIARSESALPLAPLTGRSQERAARHSCSSIRFGIRLIHAAQRRGDVDSCPPCTHASLRSQERSQGRDATRQDVPACLSCAHHRPTAAAEAARGAGIVEKSDADGRGAARHLGLDGGGDGGRVLSCSETNIGLRLVGCKSRRAHAWRRCDHGQIHGWPRAHGSGAGLARTGVG